MAVKRPAEIVWETAKGVMYREAYSVLGNHEDSEDAVMEAVLRIVRSEEKFRDLGCSDIRALSVIYVRNTAIDIYNKNRKTPYPVADLPEQIDLTPTPEEMSVDADNAERLMKLIDNMPHSYRDVLLLRCRYDMGTAEIADVLGLENGTVRTRLTRAKAWLRKNMKEGELE